MKSRPSLNFNMFNLLEVLNTNRNYFLIGIITLCILLGTTIVELRLVKNNATTSLENNLKTIQNSIHEAIHFWRDSHIEAAIGVANDSNIKSLIKKLLNTPGDKATLQKNLPQALLRKQLRSFISQHQYQGFFVVSLNGKNYGSMRNSNLGETNLVYEHDPNTFSLAISGGTDLTIPIKTDVPLKSKNGEVQQNIFNMFVVTPIKENKKTIALLMFRIDMFKSFRSIFKAGQFGKTGESYIFSKDGLLLSPSRFHDVLLKAGLAQPDLKDEHHVYLRQPKGNVTDGFKPGTSIHEQPLTDLVRLTLENTFYLHSAPLPDYRGVKTVGIGLWDSHEGIGYITQIDYKEAFTSYLAARNTIIFSALIASGLLFGLILSLIYSRQSALQIVSTQTKQLLDQNHSMQKEIQERIRIEHNLKNSQARTTAILQSAFDAIIATDEKGNIEINNPSAETMFGYQSGELIGKNIRILMPDNIRSNHDDLIQKYHTGDISNIVGRRREMVAVKKDGSTFPIELAVEEINIDGKRFYTSTINDISKTKQMIERVSSSEQEYRAIINNLSDTFYRTDHEGNILMATPSAETMLGYRVEELVGQKLSSLYVDPDGREKFLKVLTENNGSVIDYEAQLYRKDKSIVWVSTNAHFYYDEYGNVLGVEGTTRDITSRKQSEEELRESRQRLSFHIKQTPLGVIEWDIDFKVIEWNPAAEKIFGYSRNEAIGRHAGELIIPGEFKEHVDDIWYALLGQRGGQQSTNRNVNKQGDEIWCEWHNTPLVDENMDVIGVASMVMDVSTRKKAEEILTRDHMQLEDLVESRTLELNAARLEAERANEAKSLFLANMSHELRTPMHTILSFAEMGMKKAMKLDPEKLTQYFTNIHQGGQRQLTLLNNLLDLSKLESDSTAYEFATYDLQEIINEQVEQHELMLQEKNIDIKFDSGPVDSQFSFDRMRIEQVVRNLLSNAIKFSKQDNTIHIELGLSEIESEHETVPALMVSFTDEGIGIPEEELESIFDKFVQSSKTRTKAGGTGLGLAICQEIIHAHEGKIWAENNKNGGASFYFTLPIIHVSKTEIVSQSSQLN